MTELAQALSPIWFIPSVLPIIMQLFTFLHDNFLYRDKDYCTEINLLENTNKVGKAKALKNFVESRFMNLSLDGADDDDLEERCMHLTTELTRRGKLDTILHSYKDTYSKVCNISFYCFIGSLIFLGGTLVVGLLYPPSRLWTFCLGSLLALVSIYCTIKLRVFSSRLNNLKENEDLH